MQAGLDSRRYKRGRVGKCCTNLFQGLMKDASNDGPMILRILARGANVRSYLINSLDERSGVPTVQFPYQLFEDGFGLSGKVVAEDMVVPTADNKAAGKRLETLQARRANIDTRLAVFRNGY